MQKTKIKKVRIGIEIEREGVSPVFVRTKLPHNYKDDTQDLVKHDGSLRSDGAEFVSKVFMVKDTNDIYKYFIGNYFLKAFLSEGYVSFNCGFHVHVGDASLIKEIEDNFFEVKNFLLYFLRYYFQAARRKNEYINWDITNFKSHYAVLNKRNVAHLEFRGFGGVTDRVEAEKKIYYTLAILSILKHLKKMDVSFLSFKRYLGLIDNNNNGNNDNIIRFFRKMKKGLFLNLIEKTFEYEGDFIYREAIRELYRDMKDIGNFYFK